MKQDKMGDFKSQPKASIQKQVVADEDANQAQQNDVNHPDEKIATHKGSSLSTIAQNVHQIVAGMQEAEKEEDMRKSWQLAAHILDRFFLIIFLLVIFITAIAMLVVRPLTII